MPAAPRSPARALGKGSKGPKKAQTAETEAEPQVRAGGLEDADEVEVAFIRKHAADLEDEARRHASGEAASDLERAREEEEARRKVQGFNFDERRKKRGRRSFEEDDEHEEKEEREAEEKAKHLVSGGKGQTLFDTPADDRMGDLELVDPNEMKRILGPSVRFAQHAMILAESAMGEGASRAQALELLSGLYVGLDDRAYAEKALRAFGAATGILDIYPLELMEHLLEHVPGFVSKTEHRRLFGGELKARARPGEDIVLEYDAGLRIRGFALGGGPRPGYLFEPTDEGIYRLRFESEGQFRAMVSAITKDGWLFIDELDATISSDAPSPPELVVSPDAAAERRPAGSDSPSGGEASGETGTEEGARSAAEEGNGLGAADRRGLPDDLSKLSFPRRI